MSYLFFSCTTIFFSLFFTLSPNLYAAQKWWDSECDRAFLESIEPLELVEYDFQGNNTGNNTSESENNAYYIVEKSHSLQEKNSIIADCLPEHMPTAIQKTPKTKLAVFTRLSYPDRVKKICMNSLTIAIIPTPEEYATAEKEWIKPEQPIMAEIIITPRLQLSTLLKVAEQYSKTPVILQNQDGTQKITNIFQLADYLQKIEQPPAIIWATPAYKLEKNKKTEKEL